MLRANLKDGSSAASQLEADRPAPAAAVGSGDFAAKESEFEINNAMRTLLNALKTGSTAMEASDEKLEKPRRVLLCLGQKRDEVAKRLTENGYKVYLAQTPAQATERLREGRTEILIFSPDFAAEHGGAAVLQQRANAMYASERRRLFLVSLEDNGTTMNAHEAFLRNLNLIINTADMAQLPLILNRAVHDFNGLYHYFNRAMGVEPI